MAKNVILFIGDGMGVSTVSAARIYQAQLRGLNYKDAVLAWENFPYTALTRVRQVEINAPGPASRVTWYIIGDIKRLVTRKYAFTVSNYFIFLIS